MMIRKSFNWVSTGMIDIILMVVVMMMTIIMMMMMPARKHASPTISLSRFVAALLSEIEALQGFYMTI